MRCVYVNVKLYSILDEFESIYPIISQNSEWIQKIESVLIGILRAFIIES